MSTIEKMMAQEISEHVAADAAANTCGCGGCCQKCREHAEWLASLSDSESEEFAAICESGVYR